MKKINIFHIPCVCCFLLLAFSMISCEEEESSSGNIRFEIDCESSSIEGSYVQNATMTSLNTFNLHYLGGGTSARVSAPEINGVYIEEQEVELSTDSSVKIPITGKPIETGEFTLKIEVQINGHSYYCGQIFEVYEDTDPSAPILFNLSDEYKVINGLVTVTEIPFTVEPTMASVLVMDALIVNGLNVKIETDKKTGAGNLILTPADDFIGGDLGLVISFGARTPVNVILETSPFVNGEGTEASPYEINRVELFRKLRYLPEEHFLLTENISLEGINWSPVGTEEKPFIGTLNGNGKSVTNISLTGEDEMALFAYTGESAKISNLTISGNVEGGDYVAGLVAVNKGTIDNCKAPDMNVTGVNYLSALVARNEGTITNSSPEEILTFTNFPAMISDITAPVNRTLIYSPETAKAEITTQPENITVSINGSILTLTPEDNFTGSQMGITVSYANLTSREKTILLFAEEQFDDGDGSINNPYLISKASQFNKMRSYPEAHFKLTGDVDLNDLEEDWQPLETFSGSIDGGNHQVKNLTNGTMKGGIIVTNTGNIRNIAFTNVDVSTEVAYGIIVGEHSVGTIENVVVKGKVVSTHGNDILGGGVGEILSGQISNVYVNLEMEAACGMTGGIVGRARANASTISNCTTEGSITMTASKTRIAGIVGRGETGVIIKNCLSSMTIHSNITGTNGVGGIFGANNNNNMAISECMFTGKISNVFMCGGIAGVAANLRNCLVEGEGPGMNSIMIQVGGTINTSSAGGIVGTGKMTTENCIVRDVALSGVTTLNQPISGVSSTFQDNGYVSNSVVSNVLLNGTTVHGVTGTNANGSGNNTNNYVAGILYYTGGSVSDYVPENDPDGLDGGQKQASELTQSFYESLGFDFTNVWSWEGGKPVLKNVGYKGSIPTDI